MFKRDSCLIGYEAEISRMNAIGSDVLVRCACVCAFVQVCKIEYVDVANFILPCVFIACDINSC